jgi:hypothetical protein
LTNTYTPEKEDTQPEFADLYAQVGVFPKRQKIERCVWKLLEMDFFFLSKNHGLGRIIDTLGEALTLQLTSPRSPLLSSPPQYLACL